MKLNQIVSIEGKKLTKPQMNLLAKLAEKFGVHTDKAEQEEKTEIRVNPFSGASLAVSPLCAVLHDFVLSSYNTGKVGSVVTVNDWDRVRYFILAFWPKVYNELID